jgi:hypothetical protein
MLKVIAVVVLAVVALDTARVIPQATSWVGASWLQESAAVEPMSALIDSRWLPLGEGLQSANSKGDRVSAIGVARGDRVAIQSDSATAMTIVAKLPTAQDAGRSGIDALRKQLTQSRPLIACEKAFSTIVVPQDKNFNARCLA